MTSVLVVFTPVQQLSCGIHFCSTLGHRGKLTQNIGTDALGYPLSLRLLHIRSIRRMGVVSQCPTRMTITA
jgi:hypothetical protein